MAINVSVQYLVYNDESLSPRHYTVDPRLLPLGNPFKCHEGVVFYPMKQQFKTRSIMSLRTCCKM